MKKNSSQDFNKKTSFLVEIVYSVIVIFAFAFIALIGYGIYNDVNTTVQNSSDFSNATKLTAQTNYERYDNTTDGMFMMIFVFIFIALLTMAWFSFESPVVLIVLIVLLMALMIVGAIMSNAWYDLETDDNYSTLVNNLPITANILDHFVTYILVIILSCGIVLFMRSKT